MKSIPLILIALLLSAGFYSCRDAKEEKITALEEATATEQATDTTGTSTKPFILEQVVAIDSARTAQYYYTASGTRAAVQIRVGDVDNLGFGYDNGFDPFCGKNTKRHRFPWKIDDKDHLGTDRIMVVSSYKEGRRDGYTSSTSRPENVPVEISVSYEKPTIKIEQIVVQMMLDDFQSPVWGSSFQMHIDNKRLTYVEPIINNLKQTGPIGKLVQVGILPEDFHLFEDGAVTIKIDDPVTGSGDGFAIDFIQLLINPIDEYNCSGRISGVVKDEQGNTLEDVLVSANGLKEQTTGKDGTFLLEGVPVGMISISARKNAYQTASENFELKKDENKEVTLILKQQEEESEDYLSNELNEKGFVNLYGILFDTGKDVPKKESEPTLNELANFVKKNTNLDIRIIGHTDSDGDSSYNKDLSLRRAKAVKNWLQERNINVANLQVAGMGESSPIATNTTEAGKALNRRVEITVEK